MKLVVDKESLVSVADAIREKGGTSDSLEFPNGFVDGINAIESGGGEDTLKARLMNTLTEYTITEAFTIGQHAFNGCSKLLKFVAPNLQGAFPTNVFYGCAAINFVDLGETTSLMGASFNGNHRIETVILRKVDELVSLADAFANCNSITNPNYAYQCYFYVPKSLINDYKVATNWSNYANRFRAIEDYPEITGGVL